MGVTLHNLAFPNLLISISYCTELYIATTLETVQANTVKLLKTGNSSNSFLLPQEAIKDKEINRTYKRQRG